MRFGFAAKVLGADLPTHDSRRWQNNPSLGISIQYMHRILDYLHDNNIHMFRITSDFVPYATHPDMPQFHNQIQEFAEELAELGEASVIDDIRLSLHPSQYVVLNTEEEDAGDKAIWDLTSLSELLDAMHLGDEAVAVTHVGGAYGDKNASLERFIRRWHKMPDPAKRRVVLENDERLYSVEDILRIHQETGIRLIFDYQHHMLNNPGNMELRDALKRCLATWPAGQMPKIHFSSPRTEMRTFERKSPITGKKETIQEPPLLNAHADYVNPLEFTLFMDRVAGLSFDVMLEAKAKDLSLFRLRDFLRTRRPDLLDVREPIAGQIV